MLRTEREIKINHTQASVKSHCMYLRDTLGIIYGRTTRFATTCCGPVDSNDLFELKSISVLEADYNITRGRGWRIDDDDVLILKRLTAALGFL